MNPEILKRYGFPTALAGALLGALLYLMQIIVQDIRKDVKELQNDVDFLTTIVDLSCQPLPAEKKRLLEERKRDH